MGTQPGNNGTLCVYGGAEMTSQDELRDFDELRNRIAKLIYEGETLSMEGSGYVAQAIIDDLRLTVETHAATHSKRAMTRIIGEWEWDNQ